MTRQRVLVTGGAGYVGAVLVPKLLQSGYQVRVLDLFLFGKEMFSDYWTHPHLELVQGDLRARGLVEKAVKDCDVVIHLACISNDPSFELDPVLGKSINFDAFEPLVDLSMAAGVKRFIYASSSSVYGVKSETEVVESLDLEPLTDYSRYKAMCEEVLLKKKQNDFTRVIIRPATVCGYSPRLRLDLCVNILTTHAFHNKVIKVFGGKQLRPNIHVEDMTDLYVQSLEWPSDICDGEIYNAGYENYSVTDIAHIVEASMDVPVDMMMVPTDDIRSYHISSRKIAQDLGFKPKHSIEDAVQGLIQSFRSGQVPNAMDDAKYYNIKTMQNVSMK